MTSSHCFSSVLREDIRHKSWLIVLSVLGNMMAMPVVFLMVVANRYNTWDQPGYLAHQISRFMGGEVILPAGLVAGAGALLVGVAAFAYLFKESSVDLFESLPVKRRTNFFAKWLNGFLIWFVPFAGCFLLTFFFAWTKYEECRNTTNARAYTADIRWLGFGEFALHAFACFLVLVVLFLVVYHLCLFAVMFSGNAINSIIVFGVIGAGVFIVYGEWKWLSTSFLNTYYSEGIWKPMAYFSPLVAAAKMSLQMFRDYSVSSLQTAVCVIINALEAAALLIAAMVAYEKRPSEFAGNGMKNIVIKKTIQTISTVICAVAGFFVMYFISQDMSNNGGAANCGWGVFGALLAGAFAFCVLNVIFEMDFKSFLQHKVHMIVTVVVTTFVCVAFAVDLMGYDTYLPKESKVAEVAFYDYNMALNDANFSNLKDPSHPIHQVHFENQAAAYELLTELAEHQKDEDVYGYSITAKITLKNGKVYYRRYILSEDMTDTEDKLVTEQTYVNAFFRFDEAQLSRVSKIVIETDYQNVKLSAEQSRKILEAYNKDLESNPKEALLGEKSLAMLRVSTDPESYVTTIYVFEGMANTIKAIQDAGYGEYVRMHTAEEIKEIRISVSGDFNDLESQVFTDFGVQLVGQEMTEKELLQYFDENEVTYETTEWGEVIVAIHGEKLQNDLLRVASNYNTYRRYDYAYVDISLNNETELYVYIAYGEMPESIVKLFNIARYVDIDTSEYEEEGVYYKEGDYYIE